MTDITDQEFEAFDMAMLETLYPDRRDFVASGGRQREAITAGLKAFLNARPPMRKLGATDMASALMDARNVPERARSDSDTIADAMNEAEKILDALPWTIYLAPEITRLDGPSFKAGSSELVGEK